MADPIIFCPSEEELQMTSQRNIKCSVTGCERHFATLPAMWLHSAKTHGVFKDQAFKDAISNNKRKAHSKSVIKQFYCPAAGCKRGKDQCKPFDRFATLKTHYINQHAEKKFSCPKCGSKYGSSSYLDIHVTRCGQVFKCSCGIPYTTPEALYVHAKRHKHQLTDEFLKSRKYKWRKKSLEAEALNKSSSQTVKKRDAVPLLPKPPVFILHQIVPPAQVSSSTQTEDVQLPMHLMQKRKIQPATTAKRLNEKTLKRKKLKQYHEQLLPSNINIRDDHCASHQLQRLASTAGAELTNIPYNVIHILPEQEGPVRIQQLHPERNVTTSSDYPYTPIISSSASLGPSSSNVVTSQSPLTYSNHARDGHGTQGIQPPNLMAVSASSGMDSAITTISYPKETGEMMAGTRTSAQSRGYHSNGIIVSTNKRNTLPTAEGLITMATGSNVVSMANQSHNALSLVNSSTSTGSNDSINFRSIGTNFETLGVPTQTDFSILDLFASCDIQTQTIESIFACSPVIRETSATQTQLQEHANIAVETNPIPTTDAETLVNNMLEVSTQSSMQTQTLMAEQSTMETQTPNNTNALNMRTVELQTMTHSTIATSPCPHPGPGLQHETQETQTINTLSSHDLLSLDIYTQTGLEADDIATRTNLDELEFADIHTQTMDDFDLNVFGIDGGNSTSVQTDFPLVRVEGSHTVGTQVQRETVSANVQTDVPQ